MAYFLRHAVQFHGQLLGAHIEALAFQRVRCRLRHYFELYFLPVIHENLDLAAAAYQVISNLFLHESNPLEEFPHELFGAVVVHVVRQKHLHHSGSLLAHLVIHALIYETQRSPNPAAKDAFKTAAIPLNSPIPQELELQIQILLPLLFYLIQLFLVEGVINSG